MPREIPGFVYDAERGRYFRVQENHQHTQHVADRSLPGSRSAVASTTAITNTPTAGIRQVDGRRNGTTSTTSISPGGGIGARYTREVVNAQKRSRESDGSVRQRRKQQDKERSHTSKSKSTSGLGPTNQNQPHNNRPLSSYTHLPRHCSTRRLARESELLLRLGAYSSHPHIINTRYALSLTPRSLLSPVPNATITNPSLATPLVGASSAMFAVDPSTKHLYATTSSRGLEPPYRAAGPEEFGVTELVHRASDETDDGENSGPLYSRMRTTPILNSGPLSAVAVAAPGCVVWATHGFSGGPLFHDYPPRPGEVAGEGNGAVAEWGMPEERATVHVSTRYADRGVDVPWGNWREDFGEWGTQRFEMMGRGSGAGRVWDLKAGKEEGKVVLGTGEGVMVWDMNSGGGGVGEGLGLVKGREAMCVGWKDERVWLAGGRDGAVRLGDARDKKAVVARLRHEGAVSKVEGMQPRCDWGVLVWGLQGSAVYDLRWTKDMPVEIGTTGRQRSHGQKPLTRPFYELDVPPARMQRQYGMGFAFDPEAGIVAAAFPYALGQSRVDLWDAISGKMLDSPLIKRQYGPVPCMQYVDLEGDGSGPKSLLVGEQRHGQSEGGLEAWD